MLSCFVARRSAFGIATKPVTTSSYELNSNMWVRRSYNGQLYHGRDR